MILGTGSDIIEVARIRKAIQKEAFRRKVFTDNELKYCDKDKSAQSYAGRVAAKEAFFKALGTGWIGEMKINEVEILNDDLGKPYFELHGEVKRVLKKNKAKSVHLTISHIKELAVAFVVIER